MFIFFNDTATTEIYTLSLHDALPIFDGQQRLTTLYILLAALRDKARSLPGTLSNEIEEVLLTNRYKRSEEHTSELQSRQYLVCRLLLEKKNMYNIYDYTFRRHVLSY